MDINIARFDLVSMRLVVLCAESGSLSAAAKRAHCSISAGSQRISALEGALGRTLFLRDYRGLQLTEAGELFVRHARVILNHLEVLHEEVACADHPACDRPDLSSFGLDNKPCNETLMPGWRPYPRDSIKPLPPELVPEQRVAA